MKNRKKKKALKTVQTSKKPLKKSTFDYFCEFLDEYEKFSQSSSV